MKPKLHIPPRAPAGLCAQLKRVLLILLLLATVNTFLSTASADSNPPRIDMNPALRVIALPRSNDLQEQLAKVSATEEGWLAPQDFKTKQKWNGTDELWYKLSLSESQIAQYQVPVLILPFVIQSLSVFSEGKEFYSWGIFKPDGKIGFRGYPIHLVPLLGLKKNENSIYIRVGSGGANIGLIDGAFVAERSAVVESFFWLGLPNLALFVLALLLACLSFSAFIVTRKNITLLAYALFALSIGTFVGSHSYTLRLSTDWAKLRHSTELMSLYLSGLTFSFYLDTIFASIDKFRILNKSWKFCAVFAVCAALGEITQWAPLFKWLRPWQFFTALIFLSVPYFTVKSMFSKSVESYFVGGGLIAFTVASFAGVVFSVGGGAVTAPIFHFFIISGVFLLLAGLGGLLVYRHYDTNRKIIQYQSEALNIREAQARQEKDMEAARAVQQTLLPLSLNFPGFDTVAHWSTADQTGGDWYTGHFDEKSNIAYLFMGDVTGHGFASALVTGLAHGAVSSVFKLSQNETQIQPGELLLRIAHAVNNVVLESASRSVRAMSMICLALNSETGEIHLLNCGHPQVYLIKSNKLEVLIGMGSLLGFNEIPTFEVKRYEMEPGDRLFVYTDGILENGRTSGKSISFAKLRRMLSNREKPVAQTSTDILELLKSSWQDAPIDDDYTMILMQWGENQVRSLATEVLHGL